MSLSDSILVQFRVGHSRSVSSGVVVHFEVAVNRHKAKNTNDDYRDSYDADDHEDADCGLVVVLVV